METRRFLLAITLSVAVLILWGQLFPPKEKSLPVQRPPAEEIAAVDQESSRETAAVAPAQSQSSPLGVSEGAELGDSSVEARAVVVGEREETTTIETDAFQARFTNRGGQLLSFLLKDHLKANGEPLNLVRVREGWAYPFGLMEADGRPSALNDVLFTTESSDGGGGESLTFRYAGPAGTATKSFVFRKDGMFDVSIELPEGLGRSVMIGPGLRNPTEEEVESRFSGKSAIYKTFEDVERIDPNRESERQIVSGGDLVWAGLEDTYFLTALVFTQPVEQVAFDPILGEVSSETQKMRFQLRPEKLSPEQEDLEPEMTLSVRPIGGQLNAVAFWGPKVYDDLASLGHGLEEAVNLGPFGFLSRPLLYGLRWIHANVVSNYGFAIILMTFLIRIVLFPLNHKSVVSMQRMQDLNPKIQAIKQKFRPKLKDKQGRPNPEMSRKQNEEIMALYKQEGVNPAGGCLPMLLQIPVFFAFYSLLSSAIELRLAPWIGWIHDLSAPDPIYVLPIVMGASQFLQQKLTPSAADPAQRRIFMLMPIFFTVLFLGFPAGLVLYWLTNNVLGIAQQLVYKRARDRKAAAAA